MCNCNAAVKEIEMEETNRCKVKFTFLRKICIKCGSWFSDTLLKYIV
jgi:hypothetical protein